MNHKAMAVLQEAAVNASVDGEKLPVPAATVLNLCLIVQCVDDLFKPYKDSSDIVAIGNQMVHRLAMLRAAFEQPL